MNSPNVFDDDWAKAKSEGKKAAIGMFLQKALADDGDSMNVAFIQAPIVKEIEDFNDKTKKRNVMCANIAKFSDGPEGLMFEKIGLLEMAPKHWNNFMARRAKFGGSKVYQIERRGKVGDTQVVYDCDAIRDLTDGEREHLSSLKLIAIHQGTEGVADSEEQWLIDFRKTCAIEWERLDWDKDMAGISIKTLLGSFIAAADMTGEQRMEYLQALKLLAKGDSPELCTGILEMGEEDF